MLTSESHNDEMLRFFRQNNPILATRVVSLLNKKYGHTLVKILQRGAEIPPIFGTYKVDDITMYGLAEGIRHTKNGIECDSIAPYIIMKDLREQTRIMVTNAKSHVIIYKTHAISRYKERVGLAEETDLVDVCKDMCLAGCIGASFIVDCGEIYGTDLNCRAAKVLCDKGAFLGYMSSDTDVIYAETFLSPNELREDQEYLDSNKNPYYKMIKTNNEEWQSVKKGQMRSLSLSPGDKNFGNTQISIDSGKMKILTAEEVKAKEERFDKKIQENPNFFEDQFEPNKQKAINRMRRKGYK